MPYPLLQTRHERKSEKSDEVFRTSHAGASSEFGAASCLGWTEKTSDVDKEIQLKVHELDLGFDEQVFCVPDS
jgi:hypothetical protein